MNIGGYISYMLGNLKYPELLGCDIMIKLKVYLKNIMANPSEKVPGAENQQEAFNRMSGELIEMDKQLLQKARGLKSSAHNFMEGVRTDEHVDYDTLQHSGGYVQIIKDDAERFLQQLEEINSKMIDFNRLKDSSETTR